MSHPLLFALMVLAAYRLYQLLGRDALPFLQDVRNHARDKVAERGDGNGGWRDGTTWARGFDCPWCMGSWCAFATVAAVWAFVSLPLPALWFGGVATGVGVLGWLVDVLEDA